MLHKAKNLDMAHKLWACVGLGDHRYFYTARAADLLEHYVKAHHGRLVLPTLKIIDEPYGQEQTVRLWANMVVDASKQLAWTYEMPRISFKIDATSGLWVNSIIAISSMSLLIPEHHGTLYHTTLINT